MKMHDEWLLGGREIGQIHALKPHGGGCVVLNNVSKQIRECLEHAEDCARKAAAQPEGSRLREDFIDMERRWLKLARTVELIERLDDFSKNTQEQ